MLLLLLLHTAAVGCVGWNAASSAAPLRHVAVVGR